MFGLFQKNIAVLSPADGKIIPLEQVNDQVFSQKMIGDGVAIQIENGIIKAPIDGKLTVLMSPSHHAFVIQHKSGLEVMVHIGLDTVSLKGEGFTPLKTKDDSVKIGEPIVELSQQLLQSESVDLTTMVIVTNGEQFNVVHQIEGEQIFYCTKK